MTPVYEYSEYDRNNLVYNFATLSKEEAIEKVENFRKYEEGKAAAKNMLESKGE